MVLVYEDPTIAMKTEDVSRFMDLKDILSKYRWSYA